MLIHICAVRSPRKAYPIGSHPMRIVAYQFHSLAAPLTSLLFRRASLRASQFHAFAFHALRLISHAVLLRPEPIYSYPQQILSALFLGSADPCMTTQFQCSFLHCLSDSAPFASVPLLIHPFRFLRGAVPVSAFPWPLCSLLFCSFLFRCITTQFHFLSDPGTAGLFLCVSVLFRCAAFLIPSLPLRFLRCFAAVRAAMGYFRILWVKRPLPEFLHWLSPRSWPYSSSSRTRSSI